MTTADKNYIAFGRFLSAQELPIMQVMELLLFFTADVLSAITDEQVNDEAFAAMVKDLKNAYLICCNQTPENKANITHH